jgi:hypothetical protein
MQLSTQKFRLGRDGLTVKEHFHRIDDVKAAFVPGETIVFRFDADVMPESRAEIVDWLNHGYGSHAALRSGRLA